MAIKDVRAKEVAAKAEASAKEEKAKKLVEREAILAEIKPENIVDVMTDITNNNVKVDRNEQGKAVGISGKGKYVQICCVVNGRPTTIAGHTLEECEATKKRNEEEGITGDGFLHKVVRNSKGVPIGEAVGLTLEELEADELEILKDEKRHGSKMLRDFDKAEQLVEAGFEQKNLDQVTVKNSDFIVDHKDKFVMDLEGNTVANLEDIKSKLTRDEETTILTDRVKAK